jgi:hypothetical protein
MNDRDISLCRRGRLRAQAQYIAQGKKPKQRHRAHLQESTTIHVVHKQA